MAKKRKPKKAPKVAAAEPQQQRLVSDAALGASAMRKRSSTVVFGLPAYPPAVTKAVAEADRLAMDSSISMSASWGNTALSSVWDEGLTFLGYAYLSELAQRPEYRIMSETLATEMTREFIEFTSTEDKPGEKEPIGPITEALADIEASGQGDKIKELDAEFKRLKVQQMFAEAALHDGLFGRGHIYIDTGDTGDAEELKLSIGDGWDVVSKSKMANRPILALRTVEPVWCYPTSYNSNNPLMDDWYRPNRWYVQSSIVHSSRLLTLIGREVPDLLKPTYSFGGLSLSQMAKPYIDNWLSTRQSVNDIISAFSVFVLKTSLAASLQGDGAQLFKRAELFNNIRDNRGLMMIDKEVEDFANVSASLAGLEGLQAQAQEHMASVSHIPVVKLLGIQPAGLNASSEGELRSFYDYVLAFQEHMFRQPIKRLMGLVMLSLWGEIDESIDFNFKPLWALDEKGKAEVRKTEADTDAVLVDLGAIDPSEVRQRVIDDPDSGYAGLDPADMPEPPEPEMPLMPGMDPTDPNADPAAPPGPADQLPKAVGQKQPAFAGDSIVARGKPALRIVHDEAKFDESKHPRGPDGKFTKGAAVANAIEKAGFTHNPAGSTKDFTTYKKDDALIWQGAGENGKWVYADNKTNGLSGVGSKDLKAVLAGDPDALKAATKHYEAMANVNMTDWLGTPDEAGAGTDLASIVLAEGLEKHNDSAEYTKYANGNGSVSIYIGKKEGADNWLVSKGGLSYAGSGKEWLTNVLDGDATALADGAAFYNQINAETSTTNGGLTGFLAGTNKIKPGPIDPLAGKFSAGPEGMAAAIKGGGFQHVKSTTGDKELLTNAAGQALHIDAVTEQWTLSSPGHQTKSGTGADALNKLLAGDKPAFKAAGVEGYGPHMLDKGFPPEMTAPAAAKAGAPTPSYKAPTPPAKPAKPAKPAQPAYLTGNWGDPAEMRNTVAKVRPKATYDQEQAIAHYKGSGYSKMNDEMRFQHKLSAHAMEIHNWLAGAELPEDMTLWRGISGEYAKQLMAMVDEGSVFRDRGFMSCSTSKEFSDSWRSGNQGVLMRVDVKKGTKGAAIRGAGISKDSEYEIVIQNDYKLRVLGYDHATKTMHVELAEDTAEAIKAHATQLGVVSNPTPPPPPAQAASTAGHGKEPIDLDYMKKVGGQLGSNPGAVYQSKDGKKYYVKDSKSPDHAATEILAANLYNLAGSPTLNYVPVEGGGKVATEWQEPTKKSAKEFTTDERKEAQMNFATHAWLANWDAAGLTFDNQAIINGKPTTVDVGGALTYRAQGEPKGDAFGDKANDWDTLRDPSINPQNAELFGGMTDAQLIQSAERVTAVTNDQIKQAVADAGLPEAMATKLIARKWDIDARAAKLKQSIAAKAQAAAAQAQAKPQAVQVASGEGEASASAPKLPYAKQPAKFKVEVVAKSNPKKPGTKANEAFAKYKTGMSVKEFMDQFGSKGEALSHLNWDFAKGFIKITEA